MVFRSHCDKIWNMSMLAKFLLATFAAMLLTGAGCAEARRQDCWFEYSNPIDYSEVLKVPADPLLVLWALPYSPCTFDKKPTAFQSRD